MTTDQQKAQAIQAYNEIKAGKFAGVKIHRVKVIKLGSITFIID